MLDMADYGLIKAYRRQGKSKRWIARELGVSRNTVRRYLKEGTEPKYQRESVPSKLDPYKDYILAKLSTGPYTATRLFREIKEQGYPGGYKILVDYVGRIREEKEKEAIIRFETLPGQQGQVDWGEVGKIEEDGILKDRSFLLLTLGYSRKRYLEFTTSQDIYAFLSCLQHGFEYLGGVPREILFDNMKTVVLRREDGRPVFHPTFLQLAAYYGFIPKPGIPYKARTRGKIENGIGFVKRDFYLGRENLPTPLLNKEAKIWRERVNNGVSAAHGEVVSERAKKENLLPLPSVPYEISRLYERKADKTALFSFEGNYYSVPYLFAGQRVLVKVKEDRISVLFEERAIAHHKLTSGRGKRVMDPLHYKKEDKNFRANKGPQPIGQILKESFPLNLLLAGKYQFVEVEKRPLEYYENVAGKEKE